MDIYIHILCQRCHLFYCFLITNGILPLYEENPAIMGENLLMSQCEKDTTPE